MTVKSKAKFEKLRTKTNERHVQIYDKLLDNIEYLLEGFSKGIVNVEYDPTDIPKTTLATLDFLVASIVKVQKGHRAALGLDDNQEDYTEPEISIIQGVDIKKV